MDLGSLVRRLVPGARGTRAGSSARAGDGAPAADLGTSGPAQTWASPAAAGAWRSLPPIQRVAGPAPLVAPNAPFQAGLAAAQPAPVALATLGHERHLEAPAGLTTGIATPVQRTPAEPVPAPVRRRAGTHAPSGRLPTVAPWEPDRDVPGRATDDPFADQVQIPVDLPLAPRVIEGPSLVTASAPGHTPTGFLGAAAVSRSAAAVPAESGKSIVLVEPVVAREAATAGDPLRTTIGVASAPALPGSPPLAPLAGTAAPLIARRVRLGAPLASSGSSGSSGSPVSLVRQPSAPGASTGGAAESRPGASSFPADASAPSRAAGPGPADTSPASAPPSVVARVADASPRLGPAVPWRPQARDRAPVAPLVGGLRPVGDTTSPAVIPMPSAPGLSAGRAEDAGGPVAALAALARVDPFGTAAPRPSPSGPGFDAGATPVSRNDGATAVSPVVARDAVDEGSAFSATGSRLAWSNPWLQPEPAAPAAFGETPQTGASGNAWAGEPAQGGRPASSPGFQGAAAAATPSGPGAFAMRPRGLRVGPAVQRRAADPGAAPTAASSTGAFDGGYGTAPASTDWTGRPLQPPVARSAASGAPPVSLAPVQRADDVTATAAAAPGGEAPGSPGAPGAPGGTGAPGGPTAEKDLDDLARRLYDRIGLRLRRELLVERERSGALVDRGF